MLENVKKISNILLGISLFLAVIALPIVFVKGAMWASRNLLPPLFTVGWLAIALIVLILLPLSLFKRLRGFAGTAIFFSSYLFGLICWLSGFVITYSLWGAWGVMFGLLFLGGGVVPIGIVASLFNAEWQMMLFLFILISLTLAARIGGAAISESGR